MNRRFIVFITALFTATCGVFAQQTAESPYSYYGVGERNFGGIAEESAMGGMTIYADSTRVNMTNPATLSGLKYTAFGAGYTLQRKNIVTNATSFNAKASGFDYLALGLPIAKGFGLSLGLQPYSTVGYKLKNSSASKVNQFEGSGNVNRFFLSVGFRIFEGLNVGASFRYHFGAIEMTDLEQQSGIQFYTQEVSKSTLKGASVNFGLYLEQTLRHRLRLYSSLVFTPESKLSSENERTISTLGYASSKSGNPVLTVRDSQKKDLAALGLEKTKLVMPTEVSFGLGIGEHQQWFFGAQYTYANTKDFSNPFLTTNGVTYNNGYKMSVGGFWVPNYNSISSYWSRVTYRIGLRYEDTGIVLNGEKINDFGTSFGVSLPVKGFSNITAVFEYGSKGTKAGNLVKENYYNLKIGFTLNDKWFQRTKYQ